MRRFAPDHVVTKSLFWHFLKKMKSSGEIVDCRQVLEKSPLWVKNVGIQLCCHSHRGSHSTGQELTAAGALTLCFEMWTLAPHWARSSQIMKVKETAARKCHRPTVKQFQDSKIKFLLPPWVLHGQGKPGFTTKRPDTFC
ncbi:60S ribosomal protein L18a-like [Ursus americanus]|uniref:Uncharacterized protein n=1 Tax=Ursus maritimus TaxID=29073 RepID=A0A452UT69_URSMA|nr:60S ribosomal protein L18a-like [Ursus americanus]